MTPHSVLDGTGGIVSTIDRLWGAPPWRRASEFARSLQSSSWPEVAIVGGGLTGVSAAYHLARRGLRTILLEAGSFGEGASGRTGGLVLEGVAAGVIDGASDCIGTLDRVVREEEIECGLTLSGCWEIAHRRDGHGEALPWTDGGIPLRIVGTVAGGMVEPAALLIGLARAAVGAGAQIYQHTPVRRIVTKPVPTIETGEATVRPSYLVVAINAWIGELLPSLRAGLRSALTFAIATEPLSHAALNAIGLDRGMPFYTVDTPYLWGRALDDGRVIFGSGLVFGGAHQLERLDVARGDARAALERLETRVRGLNPTLARIRIPIRWAGPIGITDDLIPILSPLESAPEVFVAGGYSGHGVAFAVKAGKAIAEAIVDGIPLPFWGRIDG